MFSKKFTTHQEVVSGFSENVIHSKYPAFGKQVIALLFTLFLSLCLSKHKQAYCQQNAESDWKLLKKEGSITFHYKTGKCNKETAIILRISNTGTEKISGTWTLNLQEENNAVQFLGVFEDMEAGLIRTGSCKSEDPYLLIPYKVNNKIPLNLSVDIQLAHQ